MQAVKRSLDFVVISSWLPSVALSFIDEGFVLQCESAMNHHRLSRSNLKLGKQSGACNGEFLSFDNVLAVPCYGLPGKRGVMRDASGGSEWDSARFLRGGTLERTCNSLDSAMRRASGGFSDGRKGLRLK